MSATKKAEDIQNISSASIRTLMIFMFSTCTTLCLYSRELCQYKY
jgi:hypothetical protein